MDPDNASTYAANADAALAGIEALEAEVTGVLGDASGFDLIVFHDAYRYFEEAFGVEAAGAISVSEATAPSAARLAEIRDVVQALEAPCIAAEPQFDPGIVAAVSEGAGARSVILDPIGADLEPGPALYNDMMLGLARSLAGCSSPS